MRNEFYRHFWAYVLLILGVQFSHPIVTFSKEEQYGKLNGWYLYHNSEHKSCSALGSNTGGAGIIVKKRGYDGEWRLFITNTKWDSIELGRLYKLTTIFDDQKARTDWHTGGKNGFLIGNLDAEMVQEFASSTTLMIRYGEKNIETIALGGTNEIVESLKSCHLRQLSSSHVGGGGNHNSEFYALSQDAGKTKFTISARSIIRHDTDLKINLGLAFDPLILPFFFPKSEIRYDAYLGDNECPNGCYFVQQKGDDKYGEFWIRIGDKGEVSWISASGNRVFDVHGNKSGIKFSEMKNTPTFRCRGEYFQHCDAYSSGTKYQYDYSDKCLDKGPAMKEVRSNDDWYQEVLLPECIELKGFMIFD